MKDYAATWSNPAPNWNTYRGTAAEDVLLAGWWHRMEQDGDLSLFASGSRTMSELFRLMATPGKALLYQFDAQGIWIAAWAEQLLGAIMTGFWIRADRRRTRVAGWEFLCVSELFTSWGPVVGVTKQRDIVRLHQRFGYTVVGEIPGMFDGEAAIILTLSREAALEAKVRLRRLNPEYRGQRELQADEVAV